MKFRTADTKGFTLVELVVTIAVGGLILSAAVPAFREMILASRTTAMVNDFVGSLTLARSEALKRNERVTVCKSADGLSCTTAGTWDQGWIVFNDPNGDAAVTTGEDILFARLDTVQGVDASGGTGDLKYYVSYIANGTSRMTDGSIQSGNIQFCRNPRPGDSSKNRTLTVSVTGRPSIANGGCP